MSDEIKEKIAATKDRTEVFKLISSLEAPLAMLEVTAPSVKGELWVDKASRVFCAKTSGDADNGMMAMLQILAAGDATYVLQTKNRTVPKGNVDIQIADLISDEGAVIQRIKDVLWPVEISESDIPTEGAITPIPMEMLESVYKRAQEWQQERAEDDALKAAADARVEEIRQAEQAGQAETQDFTPPLEAPTEDVGADLSVHTTAAEDVGTAEKLGAAEDVGADFSVHTTTAEDVGATEELGTAEDVGADLSVRPPGTENVLEESPVVIQQQPVIEEEPVHDEPIPALETESTSPTEEIAKPVLAKPEPVSAQPDSALELTDPVLEQPEPVLEHPELVLEHPEPILDQTSPVDEEPREGLDPKRRAEMKALEIWVGEEPEKFYEPTELPVSQDDLTDHRKAEMEALSAMLAAHVELQRSAFEDREPDQPDPDAQDRQRQFENIKEFFSEAPEKFYEEVSLGAEDYSGNEELRSKVLKAMEQERDPEAFEESDPAIKDESVLLPIFKEEEEPQPEEPVAETKPEDEYVPPNLEPSPFGEDTSQLNFEDKHKGKVLLQGGQDDLSLLDRPPDKDNKFGYIDKSKFVRKDPLPRPVLIGAIAVALLMPLCVMHVVHYYSAEAEDEREQQRTASMLAADAAERQSRVSKPEEPFRMAEAAPVNANPPNNGGGGSSSRGSSGGGGVSEEELGMYKWHSPDNPPAQPTRSQIDTVSRALTLADQQTSRGELGEAARTLSAALLECPNHPNLRIRTAKIYMQLRQYDIAKDLLLQGMQMAMSQPEFDQYLAIMRELPRTDAK